MKHIDQHTFEDRQGNIWKTIKGFADMEGITEEAVRKRIVRKSSHDMTIKKVAVREQVLILIK